MHFSSPMNGSSGAGGILLYWLLCPFVPGRWLVSGRHGIPGGVLELHSLAPCDSSHAIGWSAVMLTTKSISCQSAADSRRCSRTDWSGNSAAP